MIIQVLNPLPIMIVENKENNVIVINWAYRYFIITERTMFQIFALIFFPLFSALDFKIYTAF